jgi:hypothetical protein
MKDDFRIDRRGLLFTFPTAAGATVLTSGRRAFAATNYSVIAGPGIELPCSSYFRVDANGRDWPVTLRVMKHPTAGTVRTRTFSEMRQTSVGQKIVRVTRIYYTARAGYSGSDSFAYRRITADPTDSKSGEEFIVAVTVR